MRWRLTSVGLVAGWLAGCGTPSHAPADGAVARFVLEADRGETVTLTLPRSDVRIAVAPKPVMTEFDVAGVEVAETELGPCLMFRFTGWAARDLYRLTAQHRGARLVLLIDGVPLGARRIEAPVEDGTWRVFVEVPDAELTALAARLRVKTEALRRAARDS